ncbi:DUF5615 family PIN-like protein [bacterium]|nr:DUF5615 family PIN-like protein [bacterium]
MTLNYLLDENVNPVYKVQLLRSSSELVVWMVGDPGAPPKGTLDPEILIWCGVHNFVLVTNNRTSMPVHLVDHINANRHVPGIFILREQLGIGKNLEELIRIAELAYDDEFQDQIIFLPHTFSLDRSPR